MNIEEPNGTHSGVTKTKKVGGRRSFLKKSTAGVMMTSLPAQSVWGACNASGISGGSRSTTTCDMPFLTGGRSPGFWWRFTPAFPGMFSNGSFKDVFTAYAGASSTVINNAKCDMTTYLFATTITLSVGAGPIPAATLNLGDALSSNGGIWNLAAVYLNAKFGLYAIPLPFDNEQDLIEHIWGVLAVEQGGIPTNFDSLVSSFTDGSTTQTIPVGSGCAP
jgi:hypothetical protein